MDIVFGACILAIGIIVAAIIIVTQLMYVATEIQLHTKSQYTIATELQRIWVLMEEEGRKAKQSKEKPNRKRTG